MKNDLNVSPTETYAAAYTRLGAIAEKLKSAGVSSVDTLADDVRAARQAYATCRARLDSIRAAIDAELDAVKADVGEPSGV